MAGRHAASIFGRMIEVLYNGVCPVCRAGACDLERRAAAARAGVRFTDVAAQPEKLAAYGLTLDAVRLKMHARLADGSIVIGGPAVALAWAATPPYRGLGRFVQLPVLRQIMAFGYHLTAHVLYAWNKACGRW
jgi:predicted DCC family thiol-disulfide oxidoreductase YuxK